MSNTNRPDVPAALSDCDHTGYTGCTSCGCSECGALVDREALQQLTLPSGRVVWACRECMADSNGVPVEVEEAVTRRETMTIERDEEGYLVQVVKVETAGAVA